MERTGGACKTLTCNSEKNLSALGPDVTLRITFIRWTLKCILRGNRGCLLLNYLPEKCFSICIFTYWIWNTNRKDYKISEKVGTSEKIFLRGSLLLRWLLILTYWLAIHSYFLCWPLHHQVLNLLDPIFLIVSFLLFFNTALEVTLCYSAAHFKKEVHTF